MKKTFDILLKKAINQLPKYKAEPESWVKVEQYLDFSDKINKVKVELPVYQAPENLWQRIEKDIEIKQTRTFLPWKIAATIIVIVGSTFFFLKYSDKGLSYSSEVTVFQEPESSSDSDSLTVEVTQFIENQCRINSYVCNEPDFSAKKQKLVEVNSEILKLEEVISTYGGSPSLVKTRINLENFRAQLIKDLIKKLTS